MDIVSRIKTFLSINGIAYSIFADKCDIPRPTLSQLLNGRNKKVSNEVLDKIHVAYPELSMMWLMFGEGEMMSEIGKNITNLQSSIFDENEEFNEDIESDDIKQNHVQDANPVVEALQSLSMNMVKTQDKSGSSENEKRIVNIMVFYSDNSFESFVPNK
ncbi:MAG: helix-turn-helix transcriptional regulator [Muribaculaceae bacterium]|nr:helix-turn-helix transcriptional regulator [Muribaculaceae bacterium]